MRSVSQILATFPFQSYFDTTLLHKAIAVQAVGSPIVTATRKDAQGMKGRGFALHPASQSPVAIRCQGGKADNSILTLTPGQKIMTTGFDSFEWGLPFGWLGGGNVQLNVLHDEDASVHFPSVNSPVIFHRMRIGITNTAGGTYVKNWPGGFPWSNALSGSGSMPQAGGMAVPVIPDIVMMRMRQDISAAPPTPATFSLVFRAVEAFDLGGALGATLTTTDLTVFDVTFNPQSDNGDGAYSIAWLPAEVARLVGDSASISVVDKANLYTASFIDIVRYARFM